MKKVTLHIVFILIISLGVLYLFWGNIEKVSSPNLNLLRIATNGVYPDTNYSDGTKGFLSYKNPYTWNVQELTTQQITSCIYSIKEQNNCDFYNFPTDGYPTYQYANSFRLQPINKNLYSSTGSLMLIDSSGWVKLDDENLGDIGTESKEQKQAQIDLLKKIYDQRSLDGLISDPNNQNFSFSGWMLDAHGYARLALPPKYVESSDHKWRGFYLLNAHTGDGLDINPSFNFTLINYELSKPLIVKGNIPSYYPKMKNIIGMTDLDSQVKLLNEESEKLEQGKIPFSTKIQKWQLKNLIKSLHLEISQ